MFNNRTPVSIYILAHKLICQGFLAMCDHPIVNKENKDTKARLLRQSNTQPSTASVSDWKQSNAKAKKC